jgi:hypothetical protein
VRVVSVEQMTGEGHYRVTFHNGRPVVAEIWRDGVRMVLGRRNHQGTCARCGRVTPVYEPTNTTMEVCDTCEQILTSLQESHD